MPTPDVLTWFKSSRSGGAQNCVEVAAVPGAVLVRDTKDRQGGTLHASATAWEGLISYLSPRS